MRPTSVGNVGGMKKRDKNKALMQDIFMNGQVKQKFVQGGSLVGLVGNHNLSVNITNIAGNVNGLRQQMFFDDDLKGLAANNSFMKAPNLQAMGQNNLVGLDAFMPAQKVNTIVGQGNLSFDARRKSNQVL